MQYTFNNIFIHNSISLFSMSINSVKSALLILGLALIAIPTKAQITNVFVTPFKVDQKIITASINNKQQATFVLKQIEISDFHSSVYSIKGYYYLDNENCKSHFLEFTVAIMFSHFMLLPMKAKMIQL